MRIIMIRWYLLLVGCYLLNTGITQESQPLFPWCEAGQLCYMDTTGQVYANQKEQLTYPKIEKQGAIIIPATFEKVGRFQKGIAWVKLDHKRYYYINEQQEPIVQYTFDRCYDFQEGRGRVYDYNSSKEYKGYGFIDDKGEVIVPLIYEDALDFVKGYAMVKDKEGWWLIDKAGQKLFHACSDLTKEKTSFRIEKK